MNLSTIGMDFEEFIANLANVSWSATKVRVGITMFVMIKSKMIIEMSVTVKSKIIIETVVTVKSKMIMGIETVVTVKFKMIIAMATKKSMTKIISTTGTMLKT